MQQLLITPLQPQHAQQAAALHIEGQQGTFLTSLGPEVLSVVYRALPQSAHGFGFAAMAAGDGRQGLGQEQGLGFDGWPLGEMGGYISATTGIGGLFVEMAGRRLPELLPPLLRVYRQQPRLAVRSLQTALYPLLVHEDSEVPSAELLSIMVEPHLRSHGVGALLMAAFLAECRRRSLASVTVTVDAANGGAQRFYARHGFGPLRSITLYGRPMQVLRREIG
jgi:ribosomal protein S18 acetylase RimI-like enzyme